MMKRSRVLLVLVLAGTALGGCGPHLKKLGVCSSGAYRYANPKGTSLPSLAVPSPDDLNGSPPPAIPADPAAPQPSPPGQEPGAAPPDTPPSAPPAPVATPPRTGAMLLPRAGSSFRSC